MLPRDLQLRQLAGYPPEARRVLGRHLATLRLLPLSFLPSLLREAVDYDYKFPIERAAIDRELAHLASLSSEQLQDCFAGFSQIQLSTSLEQFDWINTPAEFVEKQSAYLWSTHQLDAFRTAATAYGNRLQQALPPEPIPVRRLGIAVIGQGVPSYDGSLFRNLRKQGTYFSNVKPDGGLEMLTAGLIARSRAHPAPYAHWYIDGGHAISPDPALTTLSYGSLETLRSALLTKMNSEIARPGMGPEQLRTIMARLTPADLGMERTGDQILQRLQVKLFTEGSGTQIFSTTFAQWAAREVLRRAQALTLMVRFGPRQRQRPMNELLSNTSDAAEPDFIGSLVDADMASWYHWINQQRLPGSEQSVFLAWFEGHSQAVVISPSIPRGSESTAPVDLSQLLSLALG